MEGSTNLSKAAGSFKKIDKKARRAEKLKQKEKHCTDSDSNETAAATAITTTTATTPLTTVLAAAQGHVKHQNQCTSVKKPLSKAERRSIQEAQRKAKQEKSVASESTTGAASPKTVNISATAAKVKSAVGKTSEERKDKMDSKKKGSKSKDIQKTGLFSHLQQAKQMTSELKNDIHPAILKLGLQYSVGVVCGSNARCVALLCAFKQLISDYKTPLDKELSRDLLDSLKPCIDYLNSCRQCSVSMESAIKYLRPKIHEIKADVTEQQAKDSLCSAIDKFYIERIQESDHMIANLADKKIVDGDIIVVYAHSSLVLEVLKYSWEQKKIFSVIVVDSRPKFEGKEMLRKLLKFCPGMNCSYVMINAVSYVMRMASKVFLGAHAVLANGCIMSRVGTSQIALMAKAYNKPLLVCTETYKFSDRVQTDSFVHNELGNSNDIATIDKKPGILSPLTDSKSLNLLNLCYDVTPPEFVTGLITEAAVIPCSSAPVVIRVKQQYEE